MSGTSMRNWAPLRVPNSVLAWRVRAEKTMRAHHVSFGIMRSSWGSAVEDSTVRGRTGEDARRSMVSGARGQECPRHTLEGFDAGDALADDQGVDVVRAFVGLD